nr:phage tail tape measure C-terminal domain-containing protein [Schlegelella koreensis]
MGKGAKARDFDSSIAQIVETYEQRRQDLQRDNRNGLFKGREADYQRELDLLNEFQEKSIASYTDRYRRIEEKERDFGLGMQEALQNYIDDVANRYKAAEGIVTNALGGMEDALVKFVQTGKLDFKSLADSIAADVTRMTIRETITAPLAGWLKSAIGGKAGKAGATGGLDTSGVSSSLASLQSVGIVPTIDAFTRLQLAADGAASSLGARAGDTLFPEAGYTGELSIADLFKETDASQSEAAKSADAFGKTAFSAAGSIAQLAAAAGKGGGALSLLPSLISAAFSSTSGSGGSSGWLGSLVSLAGSAFGAEGGESYSAALAGGRAGGGLVARGRMYEVNERGPELLNVAGKQYLMMGDKGGTVTPNGGSKTEHRPIHVTNNFVLNEPTSKATQGQISAQVVRSLQNAEARFL